ncbi:MAG: hypothetical protein RJA76_875 [Bacteroidota bacterium]|jgi:hypothetical protein
MRKLKFFRNYKFLLVFILIGFGFTLKAQTSLVTGDYFSLNVKAGINISQIKTDAGSLNNNLIESLNTQKGYVVGASLRLGKSLFVQPELLFSQKGGQVKGLVNYAISGFDMQYTTLDLPLLVGYKVGHFYVLGGPVFCNNVSNNNGLKDAITSTYSSWTGGDGYKKSTMAYQIGAGVTLLGLNFDLRYEAGQNIFNTDALPNVSTKPSLFQATLGLKIL